MKTNLMSPTDGRRRAGGRLLLIAAVVVLVAITQYAGLKDVVLDFNFGFRDGVSGRYAEQARSTIAYLKPEAA